MKLTISRTELFNRLVAVNRVINSKTPIPIVENFLFRVKDNVLTIVATDLETTLSTNITLENPCEDIVLGMPPILIEVLREMPEQMLYLEIDEDSLKIDITSAAGGYKGEFLGIQVGKNGEDFPKPKELSSSFNTLNISADNLQKAITKTIFATAEEDSRPTLTGVLFDIFTDHLTVVATDAHKLVKYELLNVSSESECSFILPKKPANTLKNILARGYGEDIIKITFDQQNVIFELPEFKMICRRIEGRFPNYDSVILRDNPNKITIDKSSFLSAVKRVKIFSNSGTGLLKLETAENSLIVSTQDLDFSTSATEQITCQYSDEPLEIGFKAELLENILMNIASNDIVLELADPTKAGIIVPLNNEENESILMLLMPIFLN